MSQRAKFAVISVLWAAIGFFMGGARRVEASPPSGAIEYHVEVVSFEDFKEREEYKALEQEFREPWRAQFAFQEKILNRAGLGGFELIQVTQPNPKAPSQTVLYFRKQK